jgi:hypothetical protein
MVALGIAVFTGWGWWTKTRNVMPLDAPVSLMRGQSVTSDFEPNFDGLYLISIEAENTIEPETLRCLMGREAEAALCKDAPLEIAGTWELSSGGKEVKRGSLEESHTAPVQSAGVARVIGEFPGKAGKKYRLLVRFTGDGSLLAPAHPRLRVRVSSLANTDLQSASVLVFSICFVCVLFGTTLLGLAVFRAGTAARRRL